MIKNESDRTAEISPVLELGKKMADEGKMRSAECGIKIPDARKCAENQYIYKYCEALSSLFASANREGDRP